MTNLFSKQDWRIPTPHLAPRQFCPRSAASIFSTQHSRSSINPGAVWDIVDRGISGEVSRASVPASQFWGSCLGADRDVGLDIPELKLAT